jgi:hypothetical protein
MAEGTGDAAAAGESRQKKRRVYLVDRAFQLKYTALMMAAGLAIALAFGLWIWQAHLQTTELVTVEPSLRSVLEAGDRQLLYVFVGIAILMAVALGLLGLLVTHRVAGPIFVMGHYLSVLARGRFPRMRTLRRSDELRTFFRLFLDAVGAIKEREARHAALLEDAARRMRAAAVRAPELEPAISALEAAAKERRLALAAEDTELTPLFVPVFGGEGREKPS